MMGAKVDNSMLIITNMYLDMGCQGRQLHISQDLIFIENIGCQDRQLHLMRPPFKRKNLIEIEYKKGHLQ